jgi:hypothetical protein
MAKFSHVASPWQLGYNVVFLRSVATHGMWSRLRMSTCNHAHPHCFDAGLSEAKKLSPGQLALLSNSARGYFAQLIFDSSGEPYECRP